MNKGVFRLFVLTLAVMALALSMPAQSSGGSISGRVVDDSGSSIPGVTITATHRGTGATRTTVSNSAGEYAIPSLPPAEYDITGELSGFRPVRVERLTVNVGTDTNVKLTLKPGLEESITVTADSVLVDTTRSQISAVVGEAMVENLPTNGRNFLDFALTTPGVVKDVRAGDLSFGGQRGTLNSLVIDGANNDNTFFGQALGRTGSGRAPYQFSQDAVKEFQINTNAYSAEYGRAGGAVINVVTKSGTNEFDGTAFYFLRDKRYNANDYINEINNRAKGPYHFDQFGASLGGPLVSDKHFFFVNYDAQRNTTPNLVVLSLPSNTPTDADTVAGIARLQALAESYERNQDQDVYLVKTDHNLFADHHLTLRYNRQEYTGMNGETGGTTNALEHSGDSLVTTDTLTFNYTIPVSSSVFNELRGQWAKDKEPGKANSTNSEAVIRQGGQTILTIGRNNFSPRETTIERYQLADTATMLFGQHTLKAGFDVNKDDILNYFPGLFNGSYTFNSIASFHRGRPNGTGELYRQNFAGPGTDGPTTRPDMTEYAIFLQDEWHLTRTFTLNTGLRYDYQSLAQPEIRNPDTQLAAAGIDTSFVPEDDNNVALRLGFAYDMGGRGRSVLRGGYGTFYGRTPAIMVGTAHSNNGIQVVSYEFRGDQVPTYPNIITSIPAGASGLRPSIFVFDREFENPMVHQANVGIEQAMTNDISIGINYQYIKGDDLPRSIDINVGDSTIVTTPIAGGGSASYRQYSTTKPFANFNRIIEFQSTANSEYNGITMDVSRRFAGTWQARLAYTYSRAKDDRPDATAVVVGTDDAKYAQDPLDLQGDWAWADNDVRHRAVLSGLWNIDAAPGSDSGIAKAFLNGWTLSGVFTYQTGQPYTAVVNSDLNRDGNAANDRAPGFARNTFRNPDFISLDPRIAKNIPIGGAASVQIIAEAFNITNESNVSRERNTYYALTGGQLVPQFTGATAFGLPQTSAGPRIVQLAAKISF